MLYLYIKAPIIGIFYAFIPQIIYFIIISILFIHQIINLDLRDIFNIKKETYLFDKLIFNKNENINLNITRVGFIFIHSGIFILYKCTLLLELKKDKNKYNLKTSFDNNIWSYINWKRFNWIIICFVLIFVEVLILNFSFTQLFANNPYIFIIVLKLISFTLEFIFEKLLIDKLLLVPLSCVLGIIEGFSTCGAESFLDFLTGIVIENGIQMGEFMYIGSLIGPSFEYVYDKIINFINFLKR